MPTSTIFDGCYVAGSPFHIPAFGSRRPPPTTTGSEAANKAIRRQKVALRKLADNDDVIKHDKFHAANLVAKSDATTTAWTPDPSPYVSSDSKKSSSSSQPTSLSDTPNHEHATSQVTPPEPEPSQQDGANTEQGQWEGPATAKEGNRKAQRQEQVVGEVEAPQGKQPPPSTAIAGPEEHDNELGAHVVVHPDVFAVEPYANDEVPGEYNPPPPPPDPPPRAQAEPHAHNVVMDEFHPLPPPPPDPPPIRDAAQTPQANPIEVRADEHDKHALALVITDTVGQLNSKPRGTAIATTATAAAAATATAIDAVTLLY